MASHRPIAIVDGELQRIPTGDTIDSSLVAQSNNFDATNGEASTINKCQPVYISADDTVLLGKADAVGTANIVALATEDIAASGTGTFAADGPLEATTGEWDAVTGGSGGLTAGEVYYLDPSTAGMLTTTAPTTTTQVVTRVGIAISTVKLDIAIRAPILL